MDRRTNQILSLVREEESPFERLGFIESSKKRRDAPHIESLSLLIHYITLCRSYVAADTRPWRTQGKLRELIIKPQGWIVLVSTVTSDSSAHLFPNKLATRHHWQKHDCATGRERKRETGRGNMTQYSQQHVQVIQSDPEGRWCCCIFALHRISVSHLFPICFAPSLSLHRSVPGGMWERIRRKWALRY